ncbi:MAG TPA: plastocyanin/azurin family copper-binding protein [Natrialbaceae archaeon]|nr:plastocyanin/azurin family copper-binding protein [Natrialbaceae archaeon]
MSPTRRTILRRASATGVLGLLAGCTDGGLGGGGYGPAGGDATDTPTTTESTTAAPTSAEPTETTAEGTSEPMGEGTTTEEPTTEGSTPTAESTTTEPTTEAPTTTAEPTTEAPTATPEPVQPTTVALQGFAFDPVRASIEPGGTVRWVNEDAAGHDVTSAQFHDAAESWSLSETLSGGASVSHTFESAGVYEYYCTIHGRSSMCGVILVGDASLSNTLPCESDGGGGGYDGDDGGDGSGGYGDDDGDGGYRFGRYLR